MRSGSVTCDLFKGIDAALTYVRAHMPELIHCLGEALSDLSPLVQAPRKARKDRAHDGHKTGDESQESGTHAADLLRVVLFWCGCQPLGRELQDEHRKGAHRRCDRYGNRD